MYAPIQINTEGLVSIILRNNESPIQKKYVFLHAVFRFLGIPIELRRVIILHYSPLLQLPELQAFHSTFESNEWVSKGMIRWKLPDGWLDHTFYLFTETYRYHNKRDRSWYFRAPDGHHLRYIEHLFSLNVMPLRKPPDIVRQTFVQKLEEEIKEYYYSTTNKESEMDFRHYFHDVGGQALSVCLQKRYVFAEKNPALCETFATYSREKLLTMVWNPTSKTLIPFQNKPPDLEYAVDIVSNQRRDQVVPPAKISDRMKKDCLPWRTHWYPTIMESIVSTSAQTYFDEVLPRLATLGK
jgi:hypothetical protein